MPSIKSYQGDGRVRCVRAFIEFSERERHGHGCTVGITSALSYCTRGGVEPRRERIPCDVETFGLSTGDNQRTATVAVAGGTKPTPSIDQRRAAEALGG
jgi:hypothetical protein